MSEHVEKLNRARGQMVRLRRDLSETLSKLGYDRSGSQITSFIEVSLAIEEIDKAIADEHCIATELQRTLTNRPTSIGK
jgi:hypothetical protein